MIARTRRTIVNSYRTASSRSVQSMHLNASNLIPPSVVFNDNHLLVVNKPPGWHSVPNPIPRTIPPSTSRPINNSRSKCLLTYLQSMKLGGGSQQDFLKPLHRIDQPCSGLLVFGKTSKAASRITKSWKRGLVEKEYLCVVSTDHFPRLLDASSSSSFASSSEEVWYRLDGLLKKSPKCSTSSTPKQNHSRKSTKRSVTILPATAVHRPHDETKKIFREVGLEWMVVSQHHLQQEQLTLLDLSDRYTLLRVRTNQGARHQVRALLSQVGDCPIAGDVRYDGTRSQRHISNETIHPTSQPLPDRSVALHAWRIHFTDQTFKLGSLAGTIDVEAPIPKTWKKFFVG